ncbi:protein-L-isoaspartate O-methyltransferase [Parcubacteria bacterium DG_72]|nr:MAG: protein-L-isoaspartate O-methyltransferase [Parcubacteria bacterium DG_72]
MSLIDSLIKDKWLKTPIIIEAFRKVKRKDFMLARQSPEGVGGQEVEILAEINQAMPISSGQTISQPLTVAFMLEQLQPKRGDNILDVGSGSGWTTALLAYIIGENGKVIAIEIIPELKDFGEKNVSKYNFIKKGIAKFILQDGSLGYNKEAPYDKILVSASAQKVPTALKEQLKIRGRMVIPIAESIFTIIKKSEKDFEQIEHPGFVFVPLV